MSNRERWTVYPLIFMTLGIAVKDKITRVVQTDSVVCRELKVTDRQGKPQVIVAPNMVVCHELLVTDRQGKPQVIVGSNASGGVVQLIPAGAAIPPGQPRIMPDQPEHDSEQPSDAGSRMNRRRTLRSSGSPKNPPNGHPSGEK